MGEKSEEITAKKNFYNTFSSSAPLGFGTSSDIKKYGISTATVRNWVKLNTNSLGRLTQRANKTKSKKRIFPLEYFCNKENILFIQKVLDYIDKKHVEIESAILSLGVSFLKRCKISKNQNVIETLKEYADIKLIDELVNLELPADEFDILGLIYQSYLQEGKKNIIGSYYTPQKIVLNMTKNFCFNNNELFFDPCCGSGAFLLSVKSEDPNNIYGADNDKIAVLISKINLLARYKDIDFIPQVYCLDYLADDLWRRHSIFEKKFDYIATNPPWGAMDSTCNSISFITSKETFSYFFVKACAQLKKDGIIRFLFPESILNVKVHKDIRKFILDTSKLSEITIYDDMFSGVTTKYVDIECAGTADKEKFYVTSNNQKRAVDLRTVYETENLVFNLLSSDDVSIVKLVREKGKFSLKDSIFALGIVTGNNKEKLSSVCKKGMEKIYTGKEIKPYILQPAGNFILYKREDFQQVAKEEIYRSSEKLVYKFISNKLVFAYDNSKSLFLNSANILIPKIPSMSIKTAAAFLNSILYQFLYIKLFGEVKILKGNLMELPFPEITKEDNTLLEKLVEQVLKGDTSKKQNIEEYIFSMFALSDSQIAYVRRCVNGKAD